MLGLSTGMALILIICVVAVIFFEFINGFHDTANAVATVIYTNSMKPKAAVIWSGICNFCGVYFGGILVAIGIINLFPISVLTDQSVAHNVAMILALVLTAIIWNIGTWYFGIPCSSSHTLLGSIFGVGLAYGLLPDGGAFALNWQKVTDAGLALLLSPIIGFVLTMAFVLFAKRYIKYKKLFAESDKKKKPSFWVRLILIGTSTCVSYTHGKNDGQKGVGLLMIVLIAIVPAHFALDHQKKPNLLLAQVNTISSIIDTVDVKNLSVQDKISYAVVKEKNDSLKSMLTGVGKFADLKKESNLEVRKDILIIAKESKELLTAQIGEKPFPVSKEHKKVMENAVKEMKTFTEYVPWWVILIISASLGMGTMIGWKRIVVTIGEKIGKEKLNYAQGASANLVTGLTIWAASEFGLPVSTTHILSSGVAGSMFATKGVKNLRAKTLTNIMIAWVVTIPVTIVMAGGLLLLFRLIF
ncbi:MAG TPA: inorganic phosphate transporter [Bacteroidales bacterium]